MAILMKTNGGVENVNPKDGKKFTLEELQGFVGGLIEAITLEQGDVAFINEEGKLTGMEKNEKATEMVQGILFPDDFIAGPMLVCKSDEVE